MKRLFFAILMIVFVGSGINAANPRYNNPENKAYWGIRLGLDGGATGYVKVGNEEKELNDSDMGVAITGIYNVPIVANLYLEPGLSVYYNQYSAVKDYIDDFGPDITDITRKKFGMRLPVMIGYHFDITKKFKIYLYTGPELEVGFVAKDQIKGYTYRPFTKWQNVYGDQGSLKRVNVLWGYGLGLSYSKFYCGFGGSQGLVNMLKNSDLRMRELHIYFQIGLNF